MRPTQESPQKGRVAPKPAAAIAGNTGKPRPTEDAKKDITCFKCGNKGHYSSECPVRIPKAYRIRAPGSDNGDDAKSVTSSRSMRAAAIVEANDDDVDHDDELDNGSQGDQDPQDHDYPVDYPSDEDWVDGYDSEEQGPYVGAIRFVEDDVDDEVDDFVRVNAGRTPVDTRPPMVNDHTARVRGKPKVPRECVAALSAYCLVNGQRAKCLFDSGCETVLCSPEFQTACKLPRFSYEKPCHLQLAVKGSKSAINYSTEATFNVNGLQVRSDMDVANIDNYEVIIGVPLLRKLKVSMHFAEVCRLEANGSPVPIFEPVSEETVKRVRA